MKWYVQWLYPGLKIKRWLFLFSIGLMTLVFGATMLMNYQIFGILEEEIFMLAYQMTGNYSYTALVLFGIFLSIVGILMMMIGVRKLVKRFIALVVPDDQNRVSRQVLGRIELAKGPHIVALGGGHGLSMLLRGLKILSRQVIFVTAWWRWQIRKVYWNNSSSTGLEEMASWPATAWAICSSRR